jgi:hypothetical protein|uniref:Uncharacterized protein n=1 Tax=uncultured marine virus TaxID=186617 RepID=A0A0F7L4W1_9VIRU|nr:hypothetical protein [uncultured marine virus]
MLNPIKMSKTLTLKYKEAREAKETRRQGQAINAVEVVLQEYGERLENLECQTEDLTNRLHAQATQAKQQTIPCDLNGEVLQMENFFPSDDNPVIEVWATRAEASRMHDHVDQLRHEIITLKLAVERLTNAQI